MPKQQYRDDGCSPEILAGAKFTGTLEMPVVERPSRIVIPDMLVPFSRYAQCQNRDAFLVVSEPDVSFSDILRNPEPYCQIAYGYAGIITLEPALFSGAKLAKQIAVTQRNRTLAHCFQRRCVEVIPHLRWEDENSYTTKNAVPGFNYEIISKKEMPDKYGETFPDQKLILLREDVYLGAAKGNGRDRFTVAHEIGHLLLHQKDTISLPRLTPHKKIKRYENPEWQADAFAGELLMPAHLINGMSISEVQKQCGVSAKAAQYQLNSLKRAN